MTNEQAKQRAAEAQRILSDPLVIEAFKTIEAQIIDSWASCPVRDVDGREFLWQLHGATKKLKGYFEGAIQDGEIVIKREQQSIKDKAVNIFKGKKNA